MSGVFKLARNIGQQGIDLANKANPLASATAQIDPLGNSMQLYGSQQKATTWDILGKSMGAYAQSQNPTPDPYAELNRQAEIARTTPVTATTTGYLSNPGSTSKTLLGQ